ncbi:right-handed parallel beta-helix repeat-containing protein [Simiduia curdlanivorans]|uniref:Polysaccharide lyase family 1 protein n=1 Tax=Simiduia curdlanivorans TaxID=1492769 RepID=A0ABV8V131_9GAMM|nr:right-handed parallel beta-helix repeat-containing protein [Simiduia curdlanivorans]MDN3637558.1 right-handed parallel beta-helix repeat-containing protein [Simiduia curdlanivorans]
MSESLAKILRSWVVVKIVFGLILFGHSACAADLNLASVRGFGMDTPGGAGGQVIKVTNTNGDGAGSLRWALAQSYPRIIVFEVGGVIDLKKSTLVVESPFVTVAGETAPSPGVTLIRGGISVKTHNVRIRHIAVRPGDNHEPARSGWDPDGISVSGALAHDVHIDHCSISWAVDENLSASGPRDKGHDFTAKRITFSHSIIAEALDAATHKKGKHSKGLLVHDFIQEVAVIGNLFAHNDRRNPYFKGHTSGVVVNNLMYDLGNAAVQVGFISEEYQQSAFTPKNPRLAVVGNRLLYGQSSYSDLPLVAYQGDVFLHDNQVLNLDEKAMPPAQGQINLLTKPPVWPVGLEVMPVSDVEFHLLKSVGARPWDRDPIDQRIIASVVNRTGKIIDSQTEVGGYPQYPTRYRKLDVPTDNIDAWLSSFERLPSLEH